MIEYPGSKNAGMVELVDSVDLGSTAKSVQVRVLLPAPNKVDSFDTKVFETINLFLFAKILAAQGFSAKRHFGIVSLCALWITLLETATVHADNRITFRFKDGTDIEVGAE